MTAQNPRPAVSPKAHGFTVVELLMAVIITGFVLAGATAFILYGTESYEKQSIRLVINSDLRKFTNALETDAAFANHFYIYDVDTLNKKNGGKSNIPTDTAAPFTADPFVASGMSGDLVLLVTSRTDSQGNVTVTRVVAYYRGDPTTPSTSPTAAPLQIYRIDSGPLSPGAATYDTSSPPNPLPIYTLYNTYIKPNIPTTRTRPLLASALVTGEASNDPNLNSPPLHPNLFYDLGGGVSGGGAFMVRSLISETSCFGTVETIDTFNFTMWPRG